MAVATAARDPENAAAALSKPISVSTSQGLAGQLGYKTPIGDLERWDGCSCRRTHVLIGYCRVSTQDQSLDLQQDALQKAGCERIFSDVASGAKAAREGLREALDFLREGDTLVVWRLDRLGRSLAHLLEVVNTLHARHIGFRSLQESLDTATSSGKLVFHIFSSLCEFERDLVRERTQAGLAAARAQGRHGGRPKVMNAKQVAMAVALRQDPQTTVTDICQTLGVSRASLYRYLSRPKA